MSCYWLCWWGVVRYEYCRVCPYVFSYPGAIAGVWRDSRLLNSSGELAISAATLLTAVESAITARLAERAVQSYTIPGGGNLEYMSLEELRKFRTELKGEIGASGAFATNHIRMGRRNS